jgi:hypothetical protein
MESPSSEAVCVYNGGNMIPGAQTERQGHARSVRGLLGGRTSPAAFLDAG